MFFDVQMVHGEIKLIYKCCAMEQTNERWDGAVSILFDGPV